MNEKLKIDKTIKGTKNEEFNSSIDPDILKVLNESYKKPQFTNDDYNVLAEKYSTRGGAVEVAVYVREFDKDGNIAKTDMVVDNELAAIITYEPGTDSDYEVGVEDVKIVNPFRFYMGLQLMLNNLPHKETVYSTSTKIS